MIESLNPEMLVAEAQAAYKRRQYCQAAAGFIAAESGFLRAGEKLRAAEMANNGSVAYLLAEEPQNALQVLEGIDDEFRKSGDIHRLALTLGNRAAAYDALDQVDEAIRDYQEAANLFNESGDQSLHISTMQALSAFHLRKRHPLEALTTMRIGINNIRKPNFKHNFLKKLLDIPFRLISPK